MTRVNRAGEPSYAGIATFSKLPLALTPDELDGVDVAIVGAPFDEAVSNRPGTRYGPRAIRNADDTEGVPPARPHMLLGVDPFAELNVVDYGDAETMPGDGAQATTRSTAGRRDLRRRRHPVILGGDHSVALPDMTAVAEHYGLGTVGVIHFDAHADTGADLAGVELSHGSPMRLVVDSGAIRGDRFIQVGLRGWWPEPDEFAWMRERGSAGRRCTSSTSAASSPASTR